MKKPSTLLAVVLVVLFFLLPKGVAHAKTENSPWYDGCITKYYGQGEWGNAEHGNDISCFGFGTPITALLSGTVTYAGWTSFGYYEVTWRLDNPSAARGSPYAYAEDMSGYNVWAGEHVNAGQTIGWSESWVEFGLTPDWAYGISNWQWGVDSLFLIQEARNGTINNGYSQQAWGWGSPYLYIIRATGRCPCNSLSLIANWYHFSNWQTLYNFRNNASIISRTAIYHGVRGHFEAYVYNGEGIWV